MKFKPFQYLENYNYGAGWDKYALDYANLLIPNTVYYLTKELAHTIVDRFRPEKDVKVLDLNCGNGNDFPFLLGRGWAVYGCDGSKGMLNKAAETYRSDVDKGNLKLFHGMLEELDEDSLDQKFDLIYSITGGFSYIDDDVYKATMTRISKLLSPTGVLITCHLTPFCLSEMIYWFLKLRPKRAFLRMKQTLEVNIKGKPYKMFLRSAPRLQKLTVPSLQLQAVLPLLAFTPPFQTGFRPHRRTLARFKKLELQSLKYPFLATIADQVVLVHTSC